MPVAGGCSAIGSRRRRRPAENREGAVGRLPQTRISVERQTRLEHRRIESGLFAGKGEIGPADILEGAERVGSAPFQARFKRSSKSSKPGARHRRAMPGGRGNGGRGPPN